jgi:hypothetical protein
MVREVSRARSNGTGERRVMLCRGSLHVGIDIHCCQWNAVDTVSLKVSIIINWLINPRTFM